MQILLAASRLLAGVNTVLNFIGQKVAIVCMAFMVLCILIQVIARYGLNSALPWPDEAARFLMLWMTGVVAPTAFRRGGFVAIDMVRLALPRVIAALVGLALLGLAFLVLLVAARIGFSEVTGFSGKFATAALYVPFGPLGICDGTAGLKAAGDLWCRVPRSWMMASLLVGSWMMLSMCAELILREILILLGRGPELPVIPDSDTVGAE